MTRARTWLTGLMLAFCPSAFALNPALDVSQYAHSSWKIRDGFFKGEISGVAQTGDGYLWLGTGFGLLRFDGVRIVPWQPPADQHLPSDQISRLLAARDGTLWIGTRSGLASWKNGKLTTYTELSGLALFGLLEDYEGSIWAGAYGLPSGKLCEIQSGAVRCHPEIGQLDHGVFSLHEDSKRNLWVGLMTGVWRWKPGPPEFYPIPGQRNGILGMADSDDGALWVSTTAGIMRLAEGKVRMAYSLPDAVRGFEAVKMRRDRDGGLWVATSGRGIVHVHQGRTDVFAQSDGLSGDRVSGFFEDREGSMWVSTVDGLDRFRELPVTTYSAKEGLSDIPNGAILGAKDGSIWATTLDGIDRLNHGPITVYRGRGARSTAGGREIAVAGLPAHLQSLFEDSGGRIWISTATGIGYLENDRFISTAVPSTLVHEMAEDRAGNLWIADQDQGLFRWSPTSDVQRTLWPTFGSSSPASVLAADPSEGGLWLGFFKGGIAYFRDGRVRASFSADDGLGSGQVNHLRFDREGALWAATEGGLSRLKDGRIATLTRKNGLPCDAVQWTIEDGAQSVWLNTPCGLVRLARAELDGWAAAADKAGRTIRTTVFDSSDGVRSRPLAGGSTPHVAKSPDGRLWFMTPSGVSVVDPGHLPFNNLPPPVHVEQVIADRSIHEASSNLRLPPLVRDLEIDYTALSFVAPEKIRFKYKLEGRDRDWQDAAGNRRQAFYSDLPPRSYRFRVMASNNSGVWNEAGASFDFSIAPAYYQTAWFRLSCVIAVLALFWALYRYRLHQVAREFNVRLDERVGERTRIARDLHDTLLQSFQGLMLRLQVVDDLLPHGEAKDELEKTLESADQAIAEGRTAVHNLRSSATITNELAEAVRALGNELASPGAATFRLVVEGPARDLHPIIRDELYRICREALRNAYSHAHAHHIEAELIYAERMFGLRIRDDGQGIEPAILEEGRPGHYGLPGMRERARQIGAKLSIWSGVAAGTEFELNLEGSIAYGTKPGRSRLRLFGKKAGRA